MEHHPVSVHKIVSGTLLIAGTTIGAGMLGIPLLTSRAGFWPAVSITVAVWVFMVCTGLLCLEATLWMHEGANVISLSRRYLGHWGKWLAGGTYTFLYYCLMVAYFAAGAPLFIQFFKRIVGVFPEGFWGYLIFGALFGGIVVYGMKVIDRINYVLMIAMFLAYAALLGAGAPAVESEKLAMHNWSQVLWASPILFSAFGYHNVIPSLTTYFHRNVRVLRSSIIWGTLIPLIIYLAWQWLIIGAVPPAAIQDALNEGLPATAALKSLVNAPWVSQTGQFFAFFAIVTSMLGVAFSMVDFLGDGLNVQRTGWTRVFLTLLTFTPAFLLSTWDPSIFVLAIGFAGGFGEAFLNGILPVAMVWSGRYVLGHKEHYQIPDNRLVLGLLFLGALIVMGAEIAVTIFIKH